jgi:hypothetical protein
LSEVNDALGNCRGLLFFTVTGISSLLSVSLSLTFLLPPDSQYSYFSKSSQTADIWEISIFLS